MQNVLETGKRVFSAAVAAATIAFSVGAGLLVSPASVSAASAGDLIKGTSLSTVYYLGYDGDRYVFPNETTFNSWGLSFDDVSTISDAALSDISLGSENVTLRPGTYWVKVQSNPKVYAVGRGGMLYWVESADVATDLAGSDWESNLIDVPDVFFGDYAEGVSLTSAMVPDGSMYEMGGTNYLAWDGMMLEVSSAGRSANNYMSRFVLDGSNIDDSDLSMGDSVTSEWTCLVDVAQTEACDESSSATGDITISEASSMPAGRTVTGGANGVEVFTFDVEAGSEAATLDGLVLHLTGAGSTSNIAAVYLYDGSTRLTESRTVNSATREVTFNSLDVTIPAHDTVTLTAKVTISTSQTAADTFGFEIESADAVTASGDVDGRFPVEGNEFTLSGSDSGTLTVTKTGTITDPTIGENDARIAQFKMEAATEDASVELITLKVDNASDHSDFNLWDGSTWLVECDNTTGDQVVCDLSDDAFFIEEGDSNIFSLTADIGGQDADTVKVYVDNAIDVVAVGGDFGNGVTVDIDDSNGYDGSSCTSSSGKCSYSTVQGGEVTFAFNGPSAGDIQVGGKDQVLLEFSLTAAQEVTVKDLDIIVYGDDDSDNDATDAVDDSAGAAASDNDGLINSAGGNLTDIKIVNLDTGRVVMGPLELDSVVTAGDDADQTIDFTDDFTVDAGETLNLAVTADISSTATSGTEFAAALDISGLSIEDLNGDALSGSDIVPGSDLTGYNQTAESASLAIALASTPGDTTTVQGTDNHTVVAFTFTAGDASDVTVTEITLSVYGDDDGSGTSTIGGGTGFDVNDYFESCSLYDGSTLVGGPESPAINGQTITFDNMDWILNAAEVAALNVKCNLANPSDTDADYFSFDIADASADVVAEDEDGDTVTATGDAANGGTTLSSANVVTVNASGSLAAAIAADMPDADFLRTGTSGNHVATYRFTATNESFIIDTISFAEEQAEDDTGTANSSAYANNITAVAIAWDGMTTASPSVAMSGNIARFSDLSIPVAVDEPMDVEVYVTVPSTDRVSGGSATSNEKVRMALYSTGSGHDYFKATGAGSGSEVAESTISEIGDDAFATDGVPTFVVKETYPSVARSSASPTSAVAGGRPEVLRFNVSASTGEDVVLDSVLFKMTASDIGNSDWNTCDTTSPGTYVKAASEFDIYDRANLTTALDTSDAAWTLYKSTGAVCDGTAADLNYVRVTFSSDKVIPAGETKTFSLYMSAAGASADNDSILFEIVTDPILASASFLTASDLTESNVTPTDTTLSVTSGAAYTVGDVLCMATDDGTCSDSHEKMLLVSISSNDLTVVRGYLNTAPDTTSGNDATDDVDRMPGSFNWKDDGVAGSVGGQDDWWGSYLVDITDFSGASSVHF